MFTTRVLSSAFEFLLFTVMSGFIIYLTYKVFIKANPDFNMEESIKKGNIAVGILMGAIIFAASMILQKGLSAVVSMFRLYISAPPENGLAMWQILLLILAHLSMAMILALISISVTLRLFGRLTRHSYRPGVELEKGNIAVGILLASVVLVTAMYVGDGVSSISKALVPQPSMGRIQIMK